MSTTPTTDATEKLAEIVTRWESATPGPWAWHGNERIHEVYLNCVSNTRVDEVFRPFIMQFVRWGLQGGQPRFRGERVMEKVSANGSLQTDHNGVIWSIDHPDAIAIAAAPADVTWLIDQLRTAIAELERIAACEPAHRARINAVLAGGGE